MQSVTTALTKLGGLSDVQVDLLGNRVSYKNDGRVPRDRIAAAIREAGFSVG